MIEIDIESEASIEGGELKEWFIALVGPWGASLFGITIGSDAATEIGQ